MKEIRVMVMGCITLAILAASVITPIVMAGLLAAVGLVLGAVVRRG